MAQFREIWLFWQLTLAVPPCKVKVRDDLTGGGFGVGPAPPFGGAVAVTGGEPDGGEAGGTADTGLGDSGTEAGEGDVAGVASSFCTA